MTTNSLNNLQATKWKAIMVVSFLPSALTPLEDEIDPNQMNGQDQQPETHHQLDNLPEEEMKQREEEALYQQ